MIIRCADAHTVHGSSAHGRPEEVDLQAVVLEAACRECSDVAFDDAGVLDDRAEWLL
ncbi:hypothetical protein [Haloplanus sp. GCM10025708]|uniref:hypothetical protein n=1 Tax=Haloplanus sp. GCM10025708 TaxID=3252679 RepID=UPI003A8DD073